MGDDVAQLDDGLVRVVFQLREYAFEVGPDVLAEVALRQRLQNAADLAERLFARAKDRVQPLRHLQHEAGLVGFRDAHLEVAGGRGLDNRGDLLLGGELIREVRPLSSRADALAVLVDHRGCHEIAIATSKDDARSCGPVRPRSLASADAGSA